MRHYQRHVALICLLSLLALNGISQKTNIIDSLPAIYSFQREIDVYINGRLLNQKWTLIPEAKPDYFPLPGYKGVTKIQFNTDVDSLIFSLTKGESKDFVVIINGTQRCWIRVQATEDVLLKKEPGILTLLMTVLVTLVVLFLRWWLPGTLLLHTGWIGVTLWWLSITVAGYLQEGYDQITMTISQLDFSGLLNGYFIFIITLVFSWLLIFFVTGAMRACKNLNANRTPVAFILSWPLVVLIPAIFPIPWEFFSYFTHHDTIIAGAQILSLIVWRKHVLLRRFSKYTIACLGLSAFGYLSLIPYIHEKIPGLLERSSQAGWSLWVFSLSIYLLSMFRKESLTEV